MASTYTPLGVELQATGENAGTWGTKTNTNLQIIEQISGGYTAVNFGSDADVTLSVSDGSTGAALAHRVLEFTSSGSLTATRNATIPLDVQQFYILKNSTTGSQSITFKYVSGSGDSVTVANGTTVIAYAKADDGTNPNIDSVSIGDVTLTGTETLTNKTLTSPKIGTSILDTNGNELAKVTATSSAVNEFTIANAATGSGPTLSSTGGDTNIDINVTPKGTGDVVLAGDTVKVGDAGAAATLTSNGAGALTVTTGGAADLVLSTNSGTNSGTVTITDAANGNITFAPNGTGVVQISGNSTQSGRLRITEDTDDGSNYIQLLAPALSSNLSLTLPSADGSADQALVTNGSGVLSFADAGGGKVLQVVGATSTNETTTTSLSYRAVTDGVSITPSATNSKVLLFANFETSGTDSAIRVATSFFRDSTEVTSGSRLAQRNAQGSTSAATTPNQMSMVFLDSPSTTSQVTYKIAFKRQDNQVGTVKINDDQKTLVYVAMEIGA